jgi:hypothetical protein
LEEEMEVGNERFLEDDVNDKMRELVDEFQIGLSEVKHLSLEGCQN